MCRAQALYEYAPNEPDELRLQCVPVPWPAMQCARLTACRVGDVIDVTNNTGEEWWEGVLHGVAGIFPAGYVQLVE